MMNSTNQAGTSFISLLVGVFLVGVGVLVFGTMYKNYSQTRTDLAIRSLSRETRQAVVGHIVRSTQIFASKNCARKPSAAVLASDGYGGKYKDIKASVIDAIGKANFSAYSFNDFLIGSTTPGGISFGRPAVFQFPGAEDPAFSAAIKRCNRYALSPDSKDKTFNGCYELVANEMQEISSGTRTRYAAEKNLIEFRLEFVNLINNEAIACRDLSSTQEAGLIIKVLTFWGGKNDKVHKIFDALAFTG